MEKKNGVSALDFFCIGFGAIVGVGWAVSINSWMNSSGGPLLAAAWLTHSGRSGIVLHFFPAGRHSERLSRSFHGKRSMSWIF